MLKITTTTTWTGTEEQLQLLLNENGFTGQKPSYDENGQPIFNEDGTQVFETMTKEEFISHIVKEGSLHGGGIMPMIRGTTASIQEKFGSLNYNAKSMNEAMQSIIQLQTTIENI